MNRNDLAQNLLALSYFAAAITASLLSLAWIYFLLSLDHYEPAFRVIGLSIAVLVIFHFIKTMLFVLHQSAITSRAETVIFIVGLALTIIGSAWLVWAIHLGLTSGDWEYYGLLSAGAVAAQGGLSLLMIRQRSAGLV